MGIIQVIDQTDENTGTSVTEDMFGLNALFTVTAPDEAQLFDRYQDLGTTNLRYPGGSVTEWYFDISDVSGGSHERSSGTFQGNTQTLTPFTDFVDLAAGLGTDVTLVVPTMTGFTQSAGEALLAGTYGQRVIDAGHLENVAEFIQTAVETAQARGVNIGALEIGNEYWGSGQMTAGEYGKLAAAMSQVMSDTFADMGIPPAAQPDIVVQTTSSAGIFSPSRDLTLHVDEATGFVYTPHEVSRMDDAFIAGLTPVTLESQDTSRPQVREMIAAFDQDSVIVEGTDGQLIDFNLRDAANALDGVVEHYYLDGGFDAVNTEEQFGFSQLELWNIELESRDAGLPDLDFYITEWNTRKNGDIDQANNRGLQQVSMSTEILYEMVTHGVTTAHFWPAIFNYSNSGTLIFKSAESLTLAGEGFALMSESLVGLAPIMDFKVAGEFAIHGYGDADRQVFFLSERSGSENLMDLDLSAAITFDADYYRVSWTELWDGGAGGTDEMAQPIISTTQVTELMAADAFDEFLMTMQAWSVVRMDIEGVDAADADSSLLGGSGPHNRLVEGSEFDDRMRGGLGNDTILGDAGDDNLSGYEGNDLIHGGDGNDFIKGGWGDDTLHGGDGNDTITGDWGDDVLSGGAGDDVLMGGDGNDLFFGGEGNDILMGGAGVDTVVYSGNQSGYTLTLSPSDTILTLRKPDGNGTDTLIDMEFLDFDTDVPGAPFDLTKYAGTTGLSEQNFESFIELYIAYFNRAPDAVGLHFWGTAFANGVSLEEMATLFIDQDETLAAYPSGTSNSAFAETVYENVLGRTPDQDGFEFWVGQLESGDTSRDQFILEVLRGVESGGGDRAYLDDKIDIGAYFAVHKGMSDAANASAAMALFDGSKESIATSVAAIDTFYANAVDANNGEFLLQVVGVLDDPFAIA
ncbi:DUF4214 domain-containing protein [Roseovarius nitratireducens]|uniref:DUF4214 domain-containing protein n=1 Tax=Roseovarius nitratireducens TaxID=2044597 RepID=UPI000CE1A1F6|nr:DUF4214 domain-containing protein [Roseovarius nitratireducens]